MMLPDVVEQVQQGLRTLALEEVEVTPGAKARLAEGLKVPEESVERMLQTEHWELPLALSVAQHLGVAVSVTRTS